MRKRALVLALVSMLMVLMVGCSANARQYREAKRLMESGSYSEAAEIFSTINEYKDSDNLYKSCLYSQGQELMEEQEYSKAADIFSSIKEYNDSEELYNSCIYNNGLAAMKKGQYAYALKCFEQIPNYKDTSDLKNECQHTIDVKMDTTAPVISGIKEDDVLEVGHGEKFNLKEYLSNKISIEDNVSGEINDFSLNLPDEDIYDSDTGEIDSRKSGTYAFSISAVDEAKNEAVIHFSVRVKNEYVEKAKKQLLADWTFEYVYLEKKGGKSSLAKASDFNLIGESVPTFKVKEDGTFTMKVDDETAYVGKWSVADTEDSIASSTDGLAYFYYFSCTNYPLLDMVAGVATDTNKLHIMITADKYRFTYCFTRK